MSNLIKQYRGDVAETCEVRCKSLKEELELELSKNESEANRLTELLTLLEKNPVVERILELLGRKY